MQPKHPNSQHRHYLRPPARDHSRQHAAAAGLARNQIDTIYDKQAVAQDDAPAAKPEPTNVYARTHTPPQADSAEALQQYHSAWQNYYQKYYEHYYVGQVQQAHEAIKGELENTKTEQPTTDKSDTLSEEEAINDLRSQLLNKVQTSAAKVRKSRHFVPAVSALIVMLAFLFLQYNSVLIAYAQAYVAPGSVNPEGIIVDPNASLAVSPEPRLIIPKINVDTAVDYTAKPDNASQMEAMRDGVAYFGIAGANSKPGQFGNTPIAGHSSNDFTESGGGKFIFARLEQLKVGDIFYLNYNGTRYTYTVRTLLVVMPNEVSKLNIGSDKAMATLITCTPLGTAEKRLLVFGEQISPSPSGATAAPSESTVAPAPNMAGKSPTLFERLFGAE